MAENRIDTFEQLALLTDEKVMSNPDQMINDSNLYHNYTWAQAWNRKKNLQGGNGIKDYLKVEYDSRGEYVNTGHVFSPQGRGSSVQHSIGWARWANELSWDIEEIETNEGDRMAQYKNLYKTKRMDVATETIDQLESDLWAAPADTMEIGINDTSVQAADVVRRPLSIPALITTAGTADFPTATTVMGLSPVTYANWQNQFSTWSNFDADIEDVLFDVYYASRWDQPGIKNNDLFTGTPQDRCVIYTQLAAMKSIRRILRDSNDTLRNLGQYDRMLNYAGKPIVRAEPTEAAGQTEDDWELFGVDWDFVYPVCRRGRFMQLITDKDGLAFVPHNQPTARILYEFTDWNLWCKSRRRLWKAYSANA